MFIWSQGWHIQIWPKTDAVWTGRPESGRPAYFRWNLGMRLYQSHIEGESKPSQWAISRNAQLGPGRLRPISKRNANLGHDQVFNIHPIQDWSMAREERVSATEDREAARGRPPGPKEAARPKKMTIEQTDRSTDLLEWSEPSTRSWWTGGATPRPAGLGEADRPPLSASDDALLCGVEAKEEVA